MSAEVDGPDRSFAFLVLGCFALFALRWALLPDDGSRALAVVVLLIPLFVSGVPDILTGVLALWLTNPTIRFRLPLYAIFLVLIAARIYWLAKQTSEPGKTR